MDTGPPPPTQASGDPVAFIGLGASAGGLGALRRFFEHTPPDSGAAFIVVMHLSAEHKSRLAELLQTRTQMPVMQVRGE